MVDREISSAGARVAPRGERLRTGLTVTVCASIGLGGFALVGIQSLHGLNESVLSGAMALPARLSVVKVVVVWVGMLGLLLTAWSLLKAPSGKRVAAAMAPGPVRGQGHVRWSDRELVGRVDVPAPREGVDA